MAITYAAILTLIYVISSRKAYAAGGCAMDAGIVEHAAGLGGREIAAHSRADARNCDVAKYYFHLRDGIELFLDEEGRELPDVAAALAVALGDARAIISHDALRGRIDLDQRLDIEDAGGRMIHRLSFADAVELIPPAA